MLQKFQYDKITAALDLSGMDKHIINYSKFLARQAGAQKLEFLHVIPSFIFPDTVGTSFEEIIRSEDPLEHRIQQKLIQEIQPTVDQADGCKVNLEILQGNPMDRLLMWVRETQPDLLVLGKKTLSGNSGIVARRIARKVGCDLCFVTENATTDIGCILVPVDFSKTSAHSMRAALVLQSRLEKVRIIVLHVIDLPTVGYRINRKADEIFGHLKKSANKSFQTFLEKYHIEKGDFQFKTAINDEFDVSNYIRKTAREENADLIMIGARGHTPAQDVVFGSVTEKLVMLGEGKPLWVVR